MSRQEQTFLIGCPDCGTVQRMLPKPTRGRLECWRCEYTLERTSGRSLDSALACSLTTLLLLFPANLLMLMTVRVGPISASTHLASGVGVSWTEGWPVVTAILGLQGIILPFLRFGLLSYTLATIRLGRTGPRTGELFRYCEILDRWAMADVLAIGFGVGYGRVESQIPVIIDTGGWCFLASAIMTLLTRASLERREIWRCLQMPPVEVGANPISCTACDLVLPAEQEGRRCPRCAKRLYRREPASYRQTMALLIASWALVPVAYLLPMSEIWQMGSVNPHSIIDGIILLFNHGFWPLGILICLVSVGIPLTKMTGLTWFLVSVHRCSSRHLKRKTKLYRFIDDAGRWSNLDPFTVMIFAPMVQFGQLVHIDVKGGSLAFLSMIVISMIAAHMFDPRMMWDAAASKPQSTSGELREYRA